MKLLQMFTISTGLGLMAMLSGCAAAWLIGGAAAGAGTVAYVNGDLESVKEKPVEEVYAASRETLEEMNMAVTSASRDDLEATLKGQTSTGKPVRIKISRIDENQSKLSIRVGWLGDKTSSQVIYKKIEQRLAT